MSVPLNVNGAVFEYPLDNDEEWGVDASGWAQAVTSGMLQMQGGNFPLTANVNFGPNFGLLSKYFQTRSSNPATTGTVRLSSADAGIAWRNNANSANLVLTTNASDQLLYNGSALVTTAGVVTSITGTANQIIASAATGNVTLSTPQNIGTTSSPTFASVTHTTDLIFKDSVLANLTIKAPTTLSTPWTLTLPIDDGTSGQVLSTDGNGNTSWINAAGGGTVLSGISGRLTYYASTGTTVSDNPNLLYTDSAGITLLNVANTNGAGVVLTKLGNQMEVAIGASGVFTLLDITNSRNIVTYSPTPNTVATTGGWSFASNVDMGSNKITSMAAATVAGDGLIWGQNFTAGTITFSPTTTGLKGTTTNNDAAAGIVGEYLKGTGSAAFSTFGVTGVIGDGASVLTDGNGDWDVTVVAVATANGTDLSTWLLGASLFPGNTVLGLTLGDTEVTTRNDALQTSASQCIANMRFSLNIGSPTPIYLKLNAGWSTGGSPTYDCRISARRVR